MAEGKEHYDGDLVRKVRVTLADTQARLAACESELYLRVTELERRTVHAEAQHLHEFSQAAQLHSALAACHARCHALEKQIAATPPPFNVPRVLKRAGRWAGKQLRKIVGKMR